MSQVRSAFWPYARGRVGVGGFHNFQVIVGLNQPNGAAAELSDGRGQRKKVLNDSNEPNAFTNKVISFGGGRPPPPRHMLCQKEGVIPDLRGIVEQSRLVCHLGGAFDEGFE